MITAVLPVVTAFYVERRDQHGSPTAGVIVFGGELALWDLSGGPSRYGPPPTLTVFAQGRVAGLVYERYRDKATEAILSLAFSHNGRRES